MRTTSLAHMSFCIRFGVGWAWMILVREGRGCPLYYEDSGNLTTKNTSRWDMVFNMGVVSRLFLEVFRCLE